MSNIRKFSIKLTGTPEERPPISYKISEYLESFIIENVLIPQKIILGGKWNIWLSFMFFNGGRFGPSGVHIYKPTTVRSDNVKLYPIQIPIVEISNSENPALRTIELLYEGITLFFVTHFKKIDLSFISDLWQSVDISYLLSLPYPAKEKEQRYVGN